MADNKRRESSPFEETYNLALGSVWHTRILLSILYIEFMVYTWGWLTSGLPAFDYKNQNVTIAWIMKFISVVVTPLRGIWASNKVFKMPMQWLSAALHYYCLVYFAVCILILGIIPIGLIYHTVNYHK